eukprot:5522467-Alexandrium_andersonii.AAC.1
MGHQGPHTLDSLTEARRSRKLCANLLYEASPKLSQSRTKVWEIRNSLSSLELSHSRRRRGMRLPPDRAVA